LIKDIATGTIKRAVRAEKQVVGTKKA